jgi:hypothetical protein
MKTNNNKKLEIPESETLLSEKKVSLTLSDLTINKIESVKLEIEKMLEVDETIILTSNNLNNIDITGIQLLYSLQRLNAKEGKKKVTFHLSITNEVEELINQAGFDIKNLKLN